MIRFRKFTLVVAYSLGFGWGWITFRITRYFGMGRKRIIHSLTSHCSGCDQDIETEMSSVEVWRTRSDVDGIYTTLHVTHYRPDGCGHTEIIGGVLPGDTMRMLRTGAIGMWNPCEDDHSITLDDYLDAALLSIEDMELEFRSYE